MLKSFMCKFPRSEVEKKKKKSREKRAKKKKKFLRISLTLNLIIVDCFFAIQNNIKHSHRDSIDSNCFYHTN